MFWGGKKNDENEHHLITISMKRSLSNGDKTQLNDVQNLYDIKMKS